MRLKVPYTLANVCYNLSNSDSYVVISADPNIGGEFLNYECYGRRAKGSIKRSKEPIWYEGGELPAMATIDNFLFTRGLDFLLNGHCVQDDPNFAAVLITARIIGDTWQ